MDYYETLGIAKDADFDAIKKAYRDAALKCHPDRNPGDADAERQFKAIANAYEVLSNPEKRKHYDRFGSASPMGPGFAPNDFFSNFFDEFWGSASNVADHARNIQVHLHLTLQEAFEGCTKEVRYQRREMCTGCQGSGGSRMGNCPNCHGTGFQRVRNGNTLFQSTCSMCRGRGKAVLDKCRRCDGSGVTEPVESMVVVEVPPGVQTGTQVRFEGQGESARAATGSAGHLFVVFVVLDHPIFRREANNLVVKVPVSYTQLVYGGDLEVPLLVGTASVAIPPGSRAGAVLRLRGKGMPCAAGTGIVGTYGDILVILDLDVPSLDNITHPHSTILSQLRSYESKNRSSGPMET